MRKILGFVTALALAVPSFAALAPGGIEYNPDLAGSGEVGSTGPFYTSGLPAWLVPGGLAASMTGSIAGIPGFSDFSGGVDSYVYFVNGVDASGGLGFAYQINLDSSSAPNLVRASLAAAGWGTVAVTDNGSDNSGSSTAKGTTSWTDGDPYFMERDAVGGNPQWQFRLGVNGTTINPGESSALVWFETDATFWTISSISLLDGGAAGAARVLTVGIPSPAAGGLGLIGLVLVGRLFRRS